MAYPTTLREKRSRITARYSQPSRVARYVMSVTHAVLGASTSKSRIRTFDATGNRC
jgi:hypothetical protein